MPEHPLIGTVLRSPGGGPRSSAVEYEVERVAIESNSVGSAFEFAYLRRLSGGSPSAPPGTCKRVAVQALDRYRVVGRSERSGSPASGGDHG